MGSMLSPPPIQEPASMGMWLGLIKHLYILIRCGQKT